MLTLPGALYPAFSRVLNTGAGAAGVRSSEEPGRLDKGYRCAVIRGGSLGIIGRAPQTSRYDAGTYSFGVFLCSLPGR